MSILSVKEAATWLNVSTRRVRFLIASGLLKAEKLGRDWILKQSSVDAYVPRPVGRPKRKKK